MTLTFLLSRTRLRRIHGFEHHFSEDIAKNEIEFTPCEAVKISIKTMTDK